MPTPPEATDRELLQKNEKRLSDPHTISPDTGFKLTAKELVLGVLAIITAGVGGTWWFTRSVAMKEDIVALRTDIDELQEVVLASAGLKKRDSAVELAAYTAVLRRDTALSLGIASDLTPEQLKKMIRTLIELREREDGGVPPLEPEK